MEETMKISTEDIRIYAKALRLSNLRNNCGDIIHKAQIDKPSYMDFIMDILKPTFPHQYITRLCFLVPGHP